MKSLASISAVLCVTVVAAFAAPRSYAPAYQYGLTGNEWWAAHARKASIVVPSQPADFRYGLTGNDWWAARARKVAHAAN